MAYTPSHILELTRAAFRQEADELLTELDSALLQLETSPLDSNAINRAFRAMHTLKGSGATVGFKEVAALLHDVEDLFNDARDGRLKITSQIVDLVLKVSDIVRQLMVAPQDALSVVLAGGMEVAAELKALTQLDSANADAGAKPLHAQAPTAPDDSVGLWLIRFVPSSGIFRSGNDPLAIIRELLSLGCGTVRANPSHVRSLREMDPELCYLSWEIQLSSSESLERLRDVFSFVEDESDVRITPVAQSDAWVLPAGAYFESTTLADFLEEAADDVSEIETQVLMLEENPHDAEHLASVRRALHNLKGLSRLVLSETRRTPPRHHPLRAISELCHQAESFVEVVATGGGVALGDGASETLLETIDWLKELRAAIPEGREVWPAELLETLRSRSGVVQEATPTVVANPGTQQSRIQSVAEQCTHVLRVVDSEKRSDVGPSSEEWKMLSRALDTLGRAAHFEGAAGIEAQARTLVAICDASSQQRDEQPVKVSDWVGFRDKYEDMLRGVAPPRTTLRPSLRSKGRTISLRPSAGPAEVALAPQGSVPAVQRSVRVEQSKLDRMMRAVGELLIAKNCLPVLADRVRTSSCVATSKEIKETGDRIAHIADDLQDAMRQIRMMPIRSVFQRFPRLIRDLARSENKQIQLIISGDETELDKTVLEQIGDPLVHLVRNAVDHGIELPESRLAQGKPEVGTVGLDVLKEGSNVVIRICDDGRGMDPRRLRDKAVEKGLLSAAAAAELSDASALELIFRPGFSTADKVTDVSGRGVGMDVVQSNVRQLHGTISLHSEMGHGSTISIKLPSSLMVSKGILVKCATEQYVLPIEGIQEMVKLRPDRVSRYRDVAMTSIRGTVCPVFALAQLLGLEQSVVVGDSASGSDEMHAAIMSTHLGPIAVIVDRLVAEIDVIVKPLSGGFDRLRVFQGATIMGDGSVALILDPTQLGRLIGEDLRPRRADSRNEAQSQRDLSP